MVPSPVIAFTVTVVDVPDAAETEAIVPLAAPVVVSSKSSVLRCWRSRQT